jgi:hypothetical protein
MVVMVWLSSGGLFCGRLAGVMFCAFLGVFEVPVLAPQVANTKDYWFLDHLLNKLMDRSVKTKIHFWHSY